MMWQHYQIWTETGSQLFVEANGTAIHNNGRPDNTWELEAWIPTPGATCCFLLSDCPAGLTISGDTMSGMPLSYTIEPLGNSQLLFRNPSTAKYLAFDANNPAINAAGDIGSKLEIRALPFRTTDSRLDPLQALNHAADFLSAESAHQIASHLTDYTAPIIASYLRLFQEDILRPIIGKLCSNPNYANIFPHLRQHFSKQQPQLSSSATQNALKFWIDNCGYKVGDHTYGTPVIWSGLLYKQGTYLEIGKYCAIAGNIDIVMANHNVRFSSTYPFVILQESWPGIDGSYSDHVPKQVIIGNDVWLGAHSCILPGAIIGDGAVVSAYSVVRGSVPPYAIVSGNPGRIIGYRFDASIISRLLAISWWNWPDWKVDAHLRLMMNEDVVPFLEAAEAGMAEDKSVPMREQPKPTAALASTRDLRAKLASAIETISSHEEISKLAVVDVLKAIEELINKL